MEKGDARKYSWVNSKILGTLYDLDKHAAMREANIKSGCPSDWYVLSIESSKKDF